MASFATLLMAAGLGGQALAGSVTATDMGPAAFMWPPDRVWSAALDNTAPCGSAASAGNRTGFPLTGGLVALVDQTEGFDLQLAISFSNEPKSNDDFSTVLIEKTNLQELDPGHTCVTVSDPPSSVKVGSNATLQIIYTSAFDSPNNETFYACADITYVQASTFNSATVPCFNATEKPDHTTTGGSASATNSPNSPSSNSPSAGVIAGAVVGSVVGVGLLAAAAFFVYRSRQRKRREAMMEQSRARAVKWDEQHASNRGSASQNSVPLRDL
ncbi:hypothetical protein GQ53DRAFT_750077 [Thozetella sp. PMI_491]|nr:hypothetical protein GQ53DRAFT_750077 [Thozetella sp. PMI_491]